MPLNASAIEAVARMVERADYTVSTQSPLRLSQGDTSRLVSGAA